MCSTVCESPSKSGSYLRCFYLRCLILDLYPNQQYSIMQSPQYLREMKNCAMRELLLTCKHEAHSSSSA